MSDYLKKRLTQRTTWLGIGALITAAATSGGVISADLFITVLTAFGLIDANA